MRTIQNIFDLKVGMICKIPGKVFYMVMSVIGCRCEISIIDFHASVVGKDNIIYWKNSDKKTSYIYHDLIGHLIIEEPGV